MGSDEFMEWLAFDRICPLPDFNRLATAIAYIVATTFKGKGVHLKDVEDFVLQRDRKARGQSSASMASVIRGVVADVERQKREAS